MNDLWVFNIADEMWTELQPTGEIPFERSGHSMSVINGNIILFGGIWDVTKELNDLHCYMISKNTWEIIADSENQDQIENSPQKLRERSPEINPNSAAFRNQDSPSSPNKNYDSSPAHFNRSITKKFKDTSISKANKTGKRKSTAGQGLRPMNTLAQLQKTQSLKYEGPIRLDSPASTMMKGSFLIKNHEISNFEQYYQSMRKRKMNMSGTVRAGDSNASPMLRKASMANDEVRHVRGKRPAARDGHTGLVYHDKFLIVFGGDRHHMPFNDTYVCNLAAELSQKLPS